MKTVYKSIQDVYDMLESIPMFGRQGSSSANFSLEAIQTFSAAMGNPHADSPAIHVAGTNGKGTTCRMLASVYQTAGYSAGLFTSPHLIHYRERVMVNGEMIPERKLLEFFQKNEKLIEEVPLTYFELSTALSFWYFRDQKVDIAIYETGLGGRLDATNIIHPLVSVITSIGLDHTDLLGDTLSKIAAEKAGIIKPDGTVVVGQLPDEALATVKAIAKKQNAKLINAGDGTGVSGRFGTNETDPNQEILSVRLNKPVVRSVIRCLSEQYPVSLQSLHDGSGRWANTYPSGISFTKLLPDRQWYFDGAHNKDAILLLTEQMKEISPLCNWTVVLSMMADKLTPDVAELISKAGNILLYPMPSERAATLSMMKRGLPEAAPLPTDQYNMPEKSWVQKNKTELVIFGGSFYFYQTVRQWMENIALQ